MEERTVQKNRDEDVQTCVIQQLVGMRDEEEEEEEEEANQLTGYSPVYTWV